MHCNNCGNLVVGQGIKCSNCGVILQKNQNVAEVIEEQKSAKQILADIYQLENKRKDLDNLSFVIRSNDEFKIATEQITIREREKRITEERIKKQIALAKEQREQAEIIEAATFKTVEARIVGEQEFIGTPEEVAKRKKISRTKKFFITLGTFMTGIVIFTLCMGYLFWRFAPPGDAYKHDFVQWMSANANGAVNGFLFDNMKLKDYYAPAKVIDYSGTYIGNELSSIDTIYATFKEGTLNGKYVKNNKEYLLNGFVGKKGEFILLETHEGVQTATITGKIFDIGYLTAERNDLTGRKSILSLEKVLSTVY